MTQICSKPQVGFFMYQYDYLEAWHHSQALGGGPWHIIKDASLNFLVNKDDVCHTNTEFLVLQKGPFFKVVTQAHSLTAGQEVGLRPKSVKMENSFQQFTLFARNL